jgi:hypothetical protein
MADALHKRSSLASTPARARSSGTACAHFAQEAAVETWLRDEVAGVYDAVKADPASTATADEIRHRLTARNSAS